MSPQITSSNLVLIKRLVTNNRKSNKPEIEQDINAINFLLEEHILLLKECINTLECIRDEPNSLEARERINVLIEQLYHLI
jgi:hypothetical protein